MNRNLTISISQFLQFRFKVPDIINSPHAKTKRLLKEVFYKRKTRKRKEKLKNLLASKVNLFNKAKKIWGVSTVVISILGIIVSKSRVF